MLCRGVTVWELPPPTQGLAALLALNNMEVDALIPDNKPLRSAAWLHSAIESVRMAFADVLAYNGGECMNPTQLQRQHPSHH